MLCVAIASLFFALAAALVKSMSQQHLPTFEIVSIRSAFSMVLSFLAARQNAISPLYGQTKHWHLLIMRGAFGAMAMTVFYFAISKLPLAEAVTILFCNPATTSLLGWLVLGEKFGVKTTIGCVAAMAGVVLVMQPPWFLHLIYNNSTPTSSATWTHDRAQGMALALSGAVLASCAYISVRVIGKREAPLTVAMYFHTVSFLSATIPLLLGIPESPVLPSVNNVFKLGGLISCSFIAQLLVNRGIQLEEASRAAAVNYTQVVYTYFIGVVVFKDGISVWGVLGSVIIAAAVLIINGNKQGNSDSSGGSSREQPYVALKTSVDDTEVGNGGGRVMVVVEEEPSSGRINTEVEMQASGGERQR
jgi:drug/metabolite transporter (DMT)-like permease